LSRTKVGAELFKNFLPLVHVWSISSLLYSNINIYNITSSSSASSTSHHSFGPRVVARQNRFPTAVQILFCLANVLHFYYNKIIWYTKTHLHILKYYNYFNICRIRYVTIIVMDVFRDNLMSNRFLGTLIEST